MINIIIYEDNEEMQTLYREIIHSLLELKQTKIKYYIFSSYNKNIESKLQHITGEKIFILDIEVPGKSGLDLARTIRNNGDWMSSIIIISNYEYLRNTGFTSKVLMLDFISKRENIKKRLKEDLEEAYNILQIKECYTFQYNGELFHIPFYDILYFEKDSNNNYSFLHTENHSYQLKESITQIEKKLKYKSNFIKTHRSCIVNVKKITCFHPKEKIVFFGNHSINLISRKNIDILKKHLKPLQIIK